MNKLQKEYISYIAYSVIFFMCIMYGYAFSEFFFPTAVSLAAPLFSVITFDVIFNAVITFGVIFNTVIIFIYLGNTPDV